MLEIINGYQLLEPFHNDDAGFSRWTIATRDNKKYFIKEFLSPVYPLDYDISKEVRDIRIAECKEFEIKQKELYEKINSVASGNINRIENFFRFDTHYYITTEKIEDEKLSMEDIKVESYETRYLLCKTLGNSVSRLHNVDIVHSDIKSSNVLLKRTLTGKLASKLIDFDASFFVGKAPESEDDFVGDQSYLAPEAAVYMMGEDIEIDAKMDVFSTGLLFHEYLSGEMPEYDHSKYDYPFEAVIDDQELIISEEIPDDMKKIIRKMLCEDPDERITMSEVMSEMRKIEKQLFLSRDNSSNKSGSSATFIGFRKIVKK